jgi:hypothetical protein
VISWFLSLCFQIHNLYRYDVAKIDAGGPVSLEDYQERLITSGGAQEVKVPLPEGGHYTLRYAYVSQRGYYPGRVGTAHRVILQSKHGSIDEQPVRGPWNQSDNPRE